MKITPHFTYNELTHSNTANELGIHNTPDAFQLSRLTSLCWNVLEPAREELGAPIHVSSGFRCLEVNRKVGSEDDSQHLQGEATDIFSRNNIDLFKVIYKLDFDQLIIEKPNEEGYPSWLHVSYVVDRPNRNEVLVFTGGKHLKYKLWVGVNNFQSVYEV